MRARVRRFAEPPALRHSSRRSSDPGRMRVATRAMRRARLAGALEVMRAIELGRGRRRGDPQTPSSSVLPRRGARAHAARSSAVSGLHEGAAVRWLGRTHVAGALGVTEFRSRRRRSTVGPMTDAIEPFTIAVPQDQLDDLAGRLAPDPLARRGDDRRHRRSVEAGPAAPVRATPHRALGRRRTTGGAPRRSSTRSRSSARRSTGSASTSCTCAHRRPTRCRS